MCLLWLLCALIFTVGTRGNSTLETSSSHTISESFCTCPSECKQLERDQNATVQLFKVANITNQIFCLSPYETKWVLGWDSEEIPLNASTEQYFKPIPPQDASNNTEDDRKYYCSSLAVDEWSPVWETSPLFIKCQETGEKGGSSRWYKLNPTTETFGLQDPLFKPTNFKDVKNLNEEVKDLQNRSSDSPFGSASDSPQQNRSNSERRPTRAKTTKISTSSHVSATCTCPVDCIKLETNKNVVGQVFRAKSNKDKIFCLSPNETEWVLGWNSDKVPLATSPDYYFQTPSAEFRPNSPNGGDKCSSLNVAEWSREWNVSHLFVKCERTGAVKGPSSWYKFVVYANVTKLDRQKIEFNPAHWKDLKSLNEAFKNPQGNPSTTNDYGLSTTAKTVIFAVTGGAAALLALSLIVVVVLSKKVRQQRKQIEMTKEEIDEFMLGVTAEIAHSKGLNGLFILPYDMRLEVPKSDVTFRSTILGSGAFGQVVKGSYQRSEVAIKMLKSNASQNAQYLRSLLGELKVMSYLGRHPNLVGLIGAITSNIKGGEVYLLFEFCSNGNAHKFVRDHRDNFVNMLAGRVPTNLNRNPGRTSRLSRFSKLYETIRRGVGLTTKDLVKWGYEVASGMEYVATKNVYHGDLAARNILLTENLTAKVGDFGLSKQLDMEKYNCYVQKKECPLPLKWMAIESLRDLTFSIQSDVWSYGVTLWELFTLGATPYPGMDWNFESWKLLCDGSRLGKPDYASDSIYNIMMSCWHADPRARPGFAQLRDLMHTELQKL